MFIREDSVGDLAQVSLYQFSPQIADILSDETAKGNFNFGGTMVHYKAQIKEWYDNISFLIGL